jgi:hypothetical protein
VNQQEIAMSSFQPSPILRTALIADAAASGVSAVLMLAGAGMLEGFTGLPAVMLHGAGLILVPFVAFVGYLAARAQLTAAAVWGVIVCNALWVAGSMLLLLSGWVAPTALGYAFVIAQAVAVAIFAELQYVGLRRPRQITA